MVARVAVLAFLRVLLCIYVLVTVLLIATVEELAGTVFLNLT